MDGYEKTIHIIPKINEMLDLENVIIFIDCKQTPWLKNKIWPL